MSDTARRRTHEAVNADNSARRFCLSPEGSEEQEEAATELLDGIAREKGINMAGRGGSIASVRAYLRRRGLERKKAAAS